MSKEMKTLTINDITYEVVDKTARDNAKIFIATPNVTTYAEAMTAYESGRAIYCYDAVEDRVGLLYRASEEEICWLTPYYQYLYRYDLLSDNTWNLYEVYWKDHNAMIALESKDSGDITDLLNAHPAHYVCTDSVSGMPKDGCWWHVSVFSDNAHDTTLVAHPIGVDSEMYIKSASNKTWGNWFKVIVADNDGNASIDGEFSAQWLQTTADNHRTDAATKMAVLDGSGWVYYRTPAEFLSDLNAYSKTEVDNAIAMAIGDAIGGSY